MKILFRYISVVFFALICYSLSAQNISEDNLKKHVYVLASDSLQGRLVNTVGGRKASRYIISQLNQMRIVPKVNNIGNKKFIMTNIVHSIEGIDSLLKQEWIVIIAHYDHLGATRKGTIYPGANDNATSVAALLEMVRNWQPTKRSVMFLWSDGEESGILGTKHFSENLPMGAENLKLVISSEMLGNMNRTNSVRCVGEVLVSEGLGIIGGVEKNGNFDVEYFPYEKYPYIYQLISTDTMPFIKMGIPTMKWNTPSRETLHKFSDTADSIDYEGLQLAASYFYRCLRALADAEKLTPSKFTKEIQEEVLKNHYLRNL